MRKILCLLLAALWIFSLIPGVSAEDMEGSIEIVVKYNGEAVNGGKLNAVRVGYLDETDRVFRRITDDREIENIGTQTAVSAMLQYYNQYSERLKVETVNVTKGKALFEDLDTGLYLFFQHNAAPGYNNLSPFLVTVPYTLDGEQVYDITIESKSELKREPKKPTTPGKGTPGTKLPQTGQLTWPVPVLACCGMAFFALGWWLCRGKDGRDGYET